MKNCSGRLVGTGVCFERTRRITGYLVGNLDRFNNAKRAEERDRLKHGGVLDETGTAALAEASIDSH